LWFGGREPGWISSVTKRHLRSPEAIAQSAALAANAVLGVRRVSDLPP